MHPHDPSRDDNRPAFPADPTAPPPDTSYLAASAGGSGERNTASDGLADHGPPSAAGSPAPPSEGTPAEPHPRQDRPVSAEPVTSVPAGEAERPVTGPPTVQLPIPMPPVTRAPLGSAFGYPARYATAPGTGYHLALPQLGTIMAGPAIGSLVAGIAALLVALGVGCAMTVAPLVTVSASVLALFFSGASGLLAGLALRQIRRGAGEYRGRGMAIAGICCASLSVVGVLFALTVLVTL